MISGTVQYEFVPPNLDCNGLNFGGTLTRPIRQATVEIVDSGTGAVIGTTVSSDAGAYAFTVNSNTMVFLRVRAELKRIGTTPSWDVEIRDNTSNTGSALASRPLYVLDGTAFSSGAANMTRNLTATTGWTGASYTGVRAAAPFAVLDTIYNVMTVIIGADAQANFPALDAYWSVNNSSSQGAGTFDENVAAGDIGTSFYIGDQLFLLGMANDDTEEFDDHVVVHEWGHYFEDNFSRSDSVGGAHGLGQSLDMRLAFGEGWATALSGIGLNNPVYCDTGGVGQASRLVGFDIEDDHFGTPGWYNEFSIINLIYDLWDTDIDGVDNDSMGFAPIFDVMTGRQPATPAFTSIFSFAANLKAQNPAQVAFIDTILGNYNIASAGIDIYGSTEVNNRNGAIDVLPVYRTIVPDGASTINICSNEQFDGSSDGNKLSEYRFLRMTVVNAGPLTFTVITTTPTPYMDDPLDDADQSDPDVWWYRIGQLQNQFVGGIPQGLSGDANQEIFTTPNAVPVGDYVIALHEFRYADSQTPGAYPPRTCFDVTIGP